MKTFSTMFKTEFKLAIRVADVPIFSFIFPMLVAIILGLVYGKTNTEMIGKTFASASTIGKGWSCRVACSHGSVFLLE